MIELKKYKFDCLYNMKSGISSKPEQAGHGYPFVSFRDVFNNYFLPTTLESLMDTSEKEQKKYSVKKGDIFLTRTSETKDELGMSCVAIKDYPEATYSGFIKRLRPKKEKVAYEKYMAFYLRSKLFRKTMNNNSIMTLRASLNEEIFSYLDLFLPPYQEQKNIGDFLFNIYSKIDLNNRINAELEAMAKMVYDYWFVQFDFPDEHGRPYKSSGGKMVYDKVLKREVPEGWRIEKVSDCCSIVDCLHSKKPDFEFEKENCYLLQLENIQDNGLIDLTKKYYVKEIDYDLWTSRIEIKDNDILITNAGRVAATAQVPQSIKTGIGRNITAIRPDSVSPTYLFLALRGYDIKRQIVLNTDTGSFFKSLNVRGINKLNIVRSPNFLEERFEKIVKPIRRKREYNNSENQYLIELRDWLLPMLMNGQVRVE